VSIETKLRTSLSIVNSARVDVTPFDRHSLAARLGVSKSLPIEDGRLSMTAEEVAATTPAAVLVPVINRPDGLSVLLTRRTDHLNDHAGQISFPGGKVDARDTSAEETALRETEEEIGLHRSHVQLLGRLPDYFIPTGFRVTPVIGWIEPPFALTLDAFEVAEAFEVPLSFLVDPNHRQMQSAMRAGRLRHFYAMPYGAYNIWGATAGMLVVLSRLLLDQ
jgi:8-oxo-dGTP pyrophosphatase MutT (NUDIX family)